MHPSLPRPAFTAEELELWRRVRELWELSVTSDEGT